MAGLPSILDVECWYLESFKMSYMPNILSEINYNHRETTINRDIKDIIVSAEEIYRKKHELLIKPLKSSAIKTPISVNKDGINIGSDSSLNQVCINEEKISSSHCRIFLDDGLFFLEDTHSLDGTFLLVKNRLELDTGFMFKCGNTEFMVTKCFEDDIKMPCLEIEQYNSIEKHKYLVKSGDLYIGTDQSNNIATSDCEMSPFHAKIKLDIQRFYLYDIFSKSGT